MIRRLFTSAANGHDDYFRRLQDALHRAGMTRPSLIIDADRLSQNVTTMMDTVTPGMNIRIVAKSLPSIPLLQSIRGQTGSRRVMVFDMPFADRIIETMPDSHLLFGKPMPADLVSAFYDRHAGKAHTSFSPERQIQWLADAPARLRQYRDIADSHRVNMGVNIEVDIGMHRGGVDNMTDLRIMMDSIMIDPNLTLRGLMGYDAHVAKTPQWLGMRARAGSRAKAAFAAAHHEVFRRTPVDAATMTFNTGGSLTFRDHKNTDTANEIAVGSALVKPSDFDHPSLNDFIPAAFIATPVLKAMDRVTIPGLESLSALSRSKTFFTYGGYWQATPVSPPGLHPNALYGRSSNQDMLNGPRNTALGVDDFIFLRPTQSEFVFQQFGDIAVYRDGEIRDFWPVIHNNHARPPRPSQG